MRKITAAYVSKVMINAPLSSKVVAERKLAQS